MNDTQSNDSDRLVQQVLHYLHERFGFHLWMITRTNGEEWVVLQSLDHGYGVSPGRSFRWADSFCSEMVKGNGPRIAPDSTCVEAYAKAPLGQIVPIKAYIGVPLVLSDGKLFGTLCAIDPDRQSPGIVKEQRQIELIAELLSSVFQRELKAADDARRNELLSMEAYKDHLTGLSNRRAWDSFMEKEEIRCRRYGHDAAVFMLDLDGLKHVNDTYGHSHGDALIVLATVVLQSIVREVDIIARIGGDEFGVVAIECNAESAEGLVERMQTEFEKYDVQVSVGYALRLASGGLKGASERADALMYEEKSRRKSIS
ncbi:MAG: sensor domain-containing diguanylate cyclase [Burkholderiaceae bacterium]